MQISDFDYALPDDLIARYPAAERRASRLLELGQATVDRQFADLRELAQPVADDETIQIGQHHVEQDEIDVAPLDPGQRRPPVPGFLDGLRFVVPLESSSTFWMVSVLSFRPKRSDAFHQKSDSVVDVVL